MIIRKKIKIQTILLNKKKFKNFEKAIDWIKEKEYDSNNFEETCEYYSFRQKDPSKFSPSSLKVISLKSGIKAIIGKLN